MHVLKKSICDTTFGIYMNKDNEHLYIGNSPIVENDDIILPYYGTEGLWELVTLKEPDPDVYSEEDLDNVKKNLFQVRTLIVVIMIQITPDQNQAMGKNLKKNALFQSMRIPAHTLQKQLQPKSLFEELEEADNNFLNPVAGKGLQKILTNTPVEYIYWNNFGELRT